MTTRHIIKAFLLLFAMTVFAVTAARSASEARFADTSLARTGGAYFVPAFGALETAGDSIEFQLEFNALQLDIRSVRGGLIANPNVEVDFSNPQKALALIRSKNFTVGSGTLFELELEPLAFQDSISLVTPLYIKINGANVEASLTAGTIRIINPIAVEFFEGLGNNAPNPFPHTTRFRFSIESDTKVKFKVFSSAGFSPGASKLDEKVFDYQITDSEGKLIASPEEFSFKRGFYYLTLTPNSWALAAGAYFLVMETNRGSYLKNFIYEK